MSDRMIESQVRRARVEKITSKPDGSFVVRYRGPRDEPRRTSTRDLEKCLYDLTVRRQAT